MAVLDEATYVATQATLKAIADAAVALPLAAFLDTIALAHATGPVIDPTTYRRGAVELEEMALLARATQQLQATVKDITARQLRRRLRLMTPDEGAEALTEGLEQQLDAIEKAATRSASQGPSTPDATGSEIPVSVDRT